jgi:hypothetical protein
VFITANSYARILGVYKNIIPTYSSYLHFFKRSSLLEIEFNEKYYDSRGVDFHAPVI